MYSFVDDKNTKKKKTLIIIRRFVLDSFESIGLCCEYELLQLSIDL